MTPLNYWMQSETASNLATFWVQIPDDLSTNAASIYMYYGNPTATTTSNGYNTFPFFDDFSVTSNGWTFSGSNAYISNGLLTINSISSGQSFAYKTGPSGLSNYRFSFSESFTGNNAGFRAWPKATTTNNINLPGVFVGRDFYYNPVNQVGYITQGGVGLPYLSPARNANWHTITVTKYGSTYTDYWDSLTSTATDSTAETGNYVQFACEWNAGGGVNVDWVFLSKYVSSEPVQGAWGSEQTQTVQPAISVFTLSLQALPNFAMPPLPQRGIYSVLPAFISTLTTSNSDTTNHIEAFKQILPSLRDQKPTLKTITSGLFVN